MDSFGSPPILLSCPPTPPLSCPPLSCLPFLCTQAQHNMALAEDMEEDIELTEAEATDLAAIRARKKQIVADHRLKKGSANNQAVLPMRARAEGKLTTENMKVGNGER